MEFHQVEPDWLPIFVRNPLSIQDSFIYVHGILLPGYYESHQNFMRRPSPRPTLAALCQKPQELSAMNILDYFVHGPDHDTAPALKE